MEGNGAAELDRTGLDRRGKDGTGTAGFVCKVQLTLFVRKKMMRARERFELEIDPHCRLTDQGLPKGDRKLQREVLIRVVEEKFGGELTWEQLLEEARSKDSPLHGIGLFNWNVKQAAEVHWRSRAQELCRHIKVCRVMVKGGQVVRGPSVPINIVTQKKGDVVIGRTSARMLNRSRKDIQEVIGLVRADFRSWLSRYQDYVGFMELFDPVIKAFEQVEVELDRSFPKKRKSG